MFWRNTNAFSTRRALGCLRAYKSLSSAMCAILAPRSLVMISRYLYFYLFFHVQKTFFEVFDLIPGPLRLLFCELVALASFRPQSSKLLLDCSRIHRGDVLADLVKGMWVRILSRPCGFNVLVEGEDGSSYGAGQKTTPSVQSHLWVSVFTCFHLPSLAFTCFHLPSLAFTCFHFNCRGI